MSISFRALITSRFLGNILFLFAGGFIVSRLSFGTHVEKCLSDGVCDNASVVSTIKVF